MRSFMTMAGLVRGHTEEQFPHPMQVFRSPSPPIMTSMGFNPPCLKDGQTLVQRPHPMHLARSLSISKSMLMLPPGVPSGQNHGWSMAPGTPVLTI